METEPLETDATDAPPLDAQTSSVQPSGADALETLTSGQKREVRGGAFQAHICVVTNMEDIGHVIEAFRKAEAFKEVSSWSYAFRLSVPAGEAGEQLLEGCEDGLDEDVGEKILGVLQRFGLQGLLLIVSRWQDYGASSGLELFGTRLYAIVIERCKDLIANLKDAMGLNQVGNKTFEPLKSPPGVKTFDFASLPSLPEPHVPTKYGKNHFMSDLNRGPSRPETLPSLVGGDVRLWMANDQCLRNLPDSELWSLRSLRQPDPRLECVLQAVAMLMGKRVPLAASTPAARWAFCREVLRSATLRTEMLLFDASKVPLDVARTALHLLDGLQVHDVRRVNIGAGALYEWAQGVARWRVDGPPRPCDSAPTHTSTLRPRCQSGGSLQRAASEALLAGRGRGAAARRPEPSSPGGIASGYHHSLGVMAN